MQVILKVFLILLVLGSIPKAHCVTLLDQIVADYHYFYSPRPFLIQMFAFGQAGVMANTDFDPLVQTWWQSHLRSDFTDNVSHGIDSYADLTQYPIALPAYAGLMWLTQGSMQTWANHCLRTLLLGGPPQAILTEVLGAGRPQTRSHQWHLFKYDRAISGHAFYGAVPLLNIAAQTDSTWIRWMAIGSSVLPGLARINENKHYPSQAFLGWWLAASATYSVWHSEKVSSEPYEPSWQLIPSPHGIYFAVVKKF